MNNNPPAPATRSTIQATDLDDDTLTASLKRMFRAADQDGNGVLDKDEFRKVLKASWFNFSEEKILQVMHEADANNDDVIQYDEFAHIVVAIVKGHGVVSCPAPAPRASLPALSDVPDAELKGYLKQLFELADEDGNGVLDKDEFLKLIQASGFNFSSEQIMKVMAETDKNKDSLIQYDEFAQVLTDILKGSVRPNTIIVTPMPPVEADAEQARDDSSCDQPKPDHGPAPFPVSRDSMIWVTKKFNERLARTKASLSAARTTFAHSGSQQYNPQHTSQHPAFGHYMGGNHMGRHHQLPYHPVAPQYGYGHPRVDTISPWEARGAQAAPYLHYGKNGMVESVDYRA